MMSSEEAPAKDTAPESSSPAGGNETAVTAAPPEAAERTAPGDTTLPADAGSGANTTTAAVESTPETEPPAESSDETPPETSPPETPRRRVRLNPTVGMAATAVPTVDAATPAADAEAPGPAPTAPDMSPLPNVAATAAVASEPVEVPRANPALDAETEAEIEAAMASGELDGALTGNIAADSQDAEAGESPLSEDELEKGAKITGKIQSIHGDDVFLDVGLRSPGVVPLRQFSRKALVGQLIEVVVERYNSDDGLILLNLPRGVRRAGGNWETVAVGQTVDCMVTGTNKGGLEVTVGGLRGFMPASQVDLGFVSDLNVYVGQKLQAQVTEVNPKKRKLVVSRRVVLQAERREREGELWTKLAVGQTRSGKVKTIKDYGAFVDIGAVDGFLHIGEISWSRIRHPSDVISEGQDVEVRILKLDPESKKISLGMKQLIADPWMAAPSNYPADSTVTGKVTRVADFGAFVQLEPGIEGLVHISEIDHKRVGRVDDVLREGQEVTAKVLEVDPDRKRISLSLKALLARPEREKRDEKPVEAYQRTHKGPLKGGTSSDAPSPAGGLFGNPGDFG